MAQRATIEKYTEAVRVVKEMNIDAWEEPVLRQAGGKAIKDLLEASMSNRTDAYLRELARREGGDRRGCVNNLSHFRL